MELSKSKLFFLLHGWISLPVWILFSFVCLTGTISVVSHEITWLANPAARAANPDGRERAPLKDLIEAVRQAVPDGRIGFVMVNEPYLVTAIGVSTKEMPNAIAYVNPYTAKVQQLAQGVTFIGFMRSLHGWLLFPWHHNYSFGYYIVTAMSLVVLGAGITGIFVYKKFWRSYARPVVRFGRDFRTVLGDLHRVAGAWSIWFLVIIGSTGVWYLVQAVLWHNDVEIWKDPEPITMQSLPAAGIETPAQLDPIRAVEMAKRALPSVNPAWIFFPEHNRAYFSVSGKGSAPIFDEFSYRAFVNPWDGSVAEARTPSSMGALQVVSHLADPLHYGRFGGLWSKSIWFLFGLIVTGMSLSGFLIWTKRTVASTAALLKRETPGADVLRQARKVHRWSRLRFMASGLLVLAPGWYFYQALRPEISPELPEQQVGTVTVAPTPADSDPPYGHERKLLKDFSFRFCDGCISRVRIAVAKVGAAPPEIDSVDGILHGTEATQHVHAPVEQITPDSRLWLTVQEWNGAISSAAWKLP